MFWYGMTGLLYFENVVSDYQCGPHLCYVLACTLAVNLFCTLVVIFNCRLIGYQADNPAGRCRTLLECFVSYSYRGLSGISLTNYVPEQQYPQQFGDLYQDVEALRLLWEVAFTLVTVSMLGAILTGIICDTFGALRDDRDSAIAYRMEHHFISGIPFASVPEEMQPKPVN
eukprot:SAG31_NODE_1425_length_8386_cov_6.678201_1_plen_170_part_10